MEWPYGALGVLQDEWPYEALGVLRDEWPYEALGVLQDEWPYGTLSVLQDEWPYGAFGVLQDDDDFLHEAECVGRLFRGIWMTGKRMPMYLSALVENFEGSV